MNAFRLGLCALAVVAFGATSALAQQKRVSPHETISTIVQGNYRKGVRVTVVYGRPYTKDPKTGEPRQIFGKLVPYGKVWRTGADEATLLITPADLKFGDTVVPAGAYTLWTLPSEDGAKLIISKEIGQWGTQYDESKDLARVDMKKETLEEPVDQFTMAIEKTSDGNGVLKMKWEKTEYSIPFSVEKKD